MSNDLWRWAAPDGTQRKVRLDELRAALAGGLIAPNTVVWRPGWRAWQPAHEVPELTSSALSAANGVVPNIPPPPLAMVAVQHEWEARSAGSFALPNRQPGVDEEPPPPPHYVPLPVKPSGIPPAPAVTRTTSAPPPSAQPVSGPFAPPQEGALTAHQLATASLPTSIGLPPPPDLLAMLEGKGRDASPGSRRAGRIDGKGADDGRGTTRIEKGATGGVEARSLPSSARSRATASQSSDDEARLNDDSIDDDLDVLPPSPIAALKRDLKEIAAGRPPKNLLLLAVLGVVALSVVISIVALVISVFRSKPSASEASGTGERSGEPGGRRDGEPNAAAKAKASAASEFAGRRATDAVWDRTGDRANRTNERAADRTGDRTGERGGDRTEAPKPPAVSPLPPAVSPLPPASALAPTERTALKEILRGDCVVSGEPHILAPRAHLASGVELLPVPGAIAVGFAVTPREGVAITVDPASLGITTTIRAHAIGGDAKRMSPVLDRGQLALVPGVDRKNDKLVGRRVVATTPPIDLGVSEGALVWAAHEQNSGTKLFSLDGSGGAVEAIRAVPLATTKGIALAFRRGSSIFVGVAKGDDSGLTADGALVDVAGEGQVGSPAIASSGDSVMVAWSARDSNQEPWQVRWTKLTIGGAPDAARDLAVPEGGPGLQTMSPSVVGLGGNKFLLAWSEGSPTHEVRAQAFTGDGRASGAPMTLSAPGINAGQPQTAIGDDGRGVVAFVAVRGKTYEIHATPISCPAR